MMESMKHPIILTFVMFVVGNTAYQYYPLARQGQANFVQPFYGQANNAPGTNGQANNAPVRQDSNAFRKDNCWTQDPMCCSCLGQYGHYLCDPAGTMTYDLPTISLPNGADCSKCPNCNKPTTSLFGKTTTGKSTSRPTILTPTRPPTKIPSKGSSHKPGPPSPSPPGPPADAPIKPSTPKPSSGRPSTPKPSSGEPYYNSTMKPSTPKPTLNPTTVKPFESVANGVLFEGDMVVPQEDVDLFLEKAGLPDNEDEGVKKAAEHRWPKKIPYVIDSSFDRPARKRMFGFGKKKTLKKKIEDALEDWEKDTCIKFEEAAGEEDHIAFVNNGRCYAGVGKGKGKQEVSINDKNCQKKMLHLIGHAIGLYHENSRPDRDEEINMNWKNIPAEQKANFGKYHRFVREDLGKYDFHSVMHDGDDAIWEDAWDKKGFTNLLRNRNDITDLDRKKINKLFRC